MTTQLEDNMENMFDFRAPEKGEDFETLVAGSPDLWVDAETPDKVEDNMRLIGGRKPDLVREHDEVNVIEIFKTLEKDEDVMTLVEGSPGMGKTTFCLKLAYDWARGNIRTECSFPEFEVLLLLKCRDIDGDIMETIRQQLLPRDIEEKVVEKLLHFMKDIHNQEKILIILDGLDELPEKSQHHVNELLHRQILPFCYVLATSRQEGGIEVRKRFVFDIHLEIKGFTEGDAFQYIRKHFENTGRGHSSKGERLIEEIKENTLLHALQNNPLNLLLLCVIFEDYEGKLPSSRTELYQVIVLCLLRRYCAKRNLEAPENNCALEKQFEESILALGELAWKCLLSDRHGFRESELTEFEKLFKGLVAREISLLFKEESLKRLNPQHEYYFLHKTFQEYLAAAYIAQKLRKQKFNVFEYINFDDLVRKYPVVFIFVSGMLAEKATVLFTQIGEKLLTSWEWDWNRHCTEEMANFFIESFNESGHAEQMAATLCNIVPFPNVITLNPVFDDEYNEFFVQVLRACKRVSNLQTPVELVTDTCGLDWDGMDRAAGYERVIDYLELCSNLTTVNFVIGLKYLTSSDVDRLCRWLSVSRNLLEFTLKFKYYALPAFHDLPVKVLHGLASCRTLTKVTFAFPAYVYNEGFFNALETGLAVLMSVVLEVRGSMRYTAIQALQKFLSNKSLNSFSLCIAGDVQDLLVAAVSEALTRQKVLKSLDLRLDGPLSSFGASFLEKSLLESSSLNNVRVCVHSDPPANWQSVVENLRLVKKSSMACFIFPNTWNNVVNNYFRPPGLFWTGLNFKQHLTVNLWGEVNCEAVEALFEILASGLITFLTLNVRGNLTSEVAYSIARCLEGTKTLSSMFINIWGELTTTEGGLVLSRLLKNNLSVHRNVHDVLVGPNESKNVLDNSIDNPAALRAFFTKIKDSKENASLIINDDSSVTKEWTRCLGDALAESTSLTSLDLTVNSYFVDADLGEDLGDSLLQSTSLAFLSLTFNCSNMKEGWLCKLGERLTKMVSLTTLSMELNGYDEGDQGDLFSPTELSSVLVAIKQLSTLSVAMHSSGMGSFWSEVVGDCLKECTSLEKLSLIFNANEVLNYFSYGLDDGLARTTSLNTLNLAIVVDNNSDNCFLRAFASLDEGLSLNASVTTLTLTVTLYDAVITYWKPIFRQGLSMNSSLTTLSLTINENGEGKSVIPEFLLECGVFGGLAKNNSVTTFNLTLNSTRDLLQEESDGRLAEVNDLLVEVGDDWLAGLCNALKKNSSLTTLKLKVNNCCATAESRLYDLSKFLIESRSLSLLELEVSFYGTEERVRKSFN